MFTQKEIATNINRNVGRAGAAVPRCCCGRGGGHVTSGADVGGGRSSRKQTSAFIPSEGGKDPPHSLQPGWERLVALSHQPLHPHVDPRCAPADLLLSLKTLLILIFIFFPGKIPLAGIFAVTEKQKGNSWKFSMSMNRLVEQTRPGSRWFNQLSLHMAEQRASAGQG